jgi:DNA invertase Pin-like site-specific DNA recombinase
MTTHAYIRVSTTKQGESVDAQNQLLQRYCSAKGLNPSVWTDEGVSARLVPLAERAGGAALLAELEPGDIIVAKSLDRLFRNVIDGVSTIETWRQQDVTLHLVDHGGAS